MNIKSIIVGSLAIALAVGGTFVKLNSEDEQAAYTPRSLSKGLYGAAGYIEYMHFLKEDPATGKIDPNLVNQVRQEIALRKKNGTNKALLGLNWTNMGPDNVGGRTRAILVDKYNSNIVYAGSVAGGLFVSTDKTQTWTQVAGHNQTNGENLAVSCITQTDNGRIFFGTGASFEQMTGNLGSTPGFPGMGVYEYVPSTGQVLPVITESFAPPVNTQSGQWSYTNAIASKGNRLYIGTKDGMLWADPDGGGNYPTALSGWTNPIFVTGTILETGTCLDIDIATDGSMVVCFSGKIYTSNSDAVGSFTRTSVSSSSRIVAAIAPSNPNVIYALRVNGASSLTSLDISLDKGATWSVIVPGGSPCIDPFMQNDCTGPQGIWDACMAVDPTDWGRVLVGGIQMYEWKYNPGSNPIGGSWLKAANLFESISNPYYIHADKHTIVWHDPNTIYVGSDGGVTRSIDGGTTWQERNLGYNVTTFFDVATSANGWIVGGSQDNGCQMFTYGSLGEITPLGATKVSGGDGFDVAFSDISGVVYTTSQFGTLLRSNGGTPGTFYDNELTGLVNGGQPFHTVIENWEHRWDPLSIDSVKIVIDSAGTQIAPGDTVYPGDTIMAGDTIWYTSLTNSIQLTTIAQSNIIIGSPKDSIMIQDPIQNKMAFALSQGVYFTKDAARLNAIAPEWHRISNLSALCFEFSRDGNHLFIGTSGGVYRIDNLSAGNDSLSLDIRSGSAVITQVTSPSNSSIIGRVTGIAIDPNNADNLIITTSGYHSSSHVYRSTNATTGLNFTSIRGVGAGSLPNMPVYDCEIDYNDANKVILGTEYGVWTSDNAFTASATAVDWNDESLGEMSHVPVMGVKQQQLRSNEAVNSGNIYLGTHGRGFFMSTDLATSINEDDFADNINKEFISDLTVYPNPINNQGTIEFNLAERTNAVAKIYTLTGSLVKTIDFGTKQKGENKEVINVSNLSIGTYIISLEAGSTSTVAKFIIAR